MTAPTSPISYQQALALAAADLAAARTAPNPTVSLATLSEQVIAGRDNASAWAKAQIQRLWVAVNPYDAAQVSDFAVAAAGLMASAQSAASQVAAAGQTQQLLALGVTAGGVAATPINVRAPGIAIKNGQMVLKHSTSHVDYDGTDDKSKVTTADKTTEAIFQRPAETYRYLRSQGASPSDAGTQASQRVDSLIDDNLMLTQRLAQQQILTQAVDLDTGKTASGPRITGYRRVIHPELSRSGTCGLCIAASDRLYKVAELMPIHANCKCTVAAATEEHDPGDDLNAIDFAQLYKHGGGTSAAHLKRTRYQVDEHGELGPVLVPKKASKPRSKKPRVKEQAADVARRNLGTYREKLDELRAQGASEDSPKVVYLKKLIDKFAT